MAVTMKWQRELLIARVRFAGFVEIQVGGESVFIASGRSFDCVVWPWSCLDLATKTVRVVEDFTPIGASYSINLLTFWCDVT